MVEQLSTPKAVPLGPSLLERRSADLRQQVTDVRAVAVGPLLPARSARAETQFQLAVLVLLTVCMAPAVHVCEALLLAGLQPQPPADPGTFAVAAG